MHKLKTAALGAVFGALALASAPASAMTINDLGAASKTLTSETQKVIWICGWYHCQWRPVVVYPVPYVYYRPYWQPYWGWHRPYWGWRRWWW